MVKRQNFFKKKYVHFFNVCCFLFIIFLILINLYNPSSIKILGTVLAIIGLILLKKFKINNKYLFIILLIIPFIILLAYYFQIMVPQYLIMNGFITMLQPFQRECHQIKITLLYFLISIYMLLFQEPSLKYQAVNIQQQYLLIFYQN